MGSTDSAAQIAWETNHSDFLAGSAEDTAGRIVSLLLRDHVRNDQLGPVIDRMRDGYRMEFERFLETVLRANPHRNVQGVASLSLAQFLNDRLGMIIECGRSSSCCRCPPAFRATPRCPKLENQPGALS